MTNEIVENLITDLTNVLTEEYDKYENGERNGAIIESEKFNGIIRIGKDLHYSQGQVFYYRNDGASINIIDSQLCIINIDEKVRLDNVKLNSKEFEFVNETISLGKSKTR